MTYKRKINTHKKLLKRKKNELIKKQIEQALIETSKHNIGLEFGGIKPYACFIHLTDDYVVQDIEFPEHLLEEYPNISHFLQSGRRFKIKHVNKITDPSQKKFFEKLKQRFTLMIYDEETEINISDTSIDKLFHIFENELLNGLLETKNKRRKKEKRAKNE